LDTHVELAKELGFLDQQSYDDNLNELTVISKQLYGLAKKVRSK
jgi:four helix bundle protein